ncbi:MAG: hypothetical protein Q9183_000375 [Haloplaca sp. 2 TL-2023]
MSRTYVGPFGRILPVIDTSEEDSSSTEGQGPSHRESQPEMATYQLPRPQLPTRLAFGTDPRPGFSEPKNYDINRQAHQLFTHRRQSFGEPRPPPTVQHGQLPSVSQLLTPGSQSSDASSSYSSRQSLTSLGDRTERSSPHPPGFPSTSPTASGNTYQDSYIASPYQAPSHDALLRGSRSFAGAPGVSSYALPVPTPQDPNVHPFAHPGAPPQPIYPSYPRQELQLTALPPTASHASHPSALYPYPHHPETTRLDPAGSNATQSVKPLPRVLGEQDIPGEGPCWVYEDGSICRKVIDGEHVNAQWGVTKAGKARKRLAIACTTCREKKIKCDPGEGKCQQCEKSGRECLFTTA